MNFFLQMCTGKFVPQVWTTFLSLCLFSIPAFAQGNEGRITGAVIDQSGGAIEEATVTIKDTQRGTLRTLTTGEAGLYAAPNLLPGIYAVRAEAKGFKATERGGILLEVSQEIRVDLTLQPGDQKEIVEVTDETPSLTTTNATLGGALSNETINNLPLNGRNFENLLVLRPGVTIYPGGGIGTQSTNGLRAQDNVYLVDGMNNDDPYWGQSIMNGDLAAGDAATILPIDAIEEFKTEFNPPAEYGWKPGAVVNVGIKSGTNNIHGTAYAYGRSDAWDARNYFDPPPAAKTPIELEQFGASVGGPIKKNKLFYFLSYEDQRYTVASPVQHRLPITTGTGGDLTTNLQLACQSVLATGTVAPLSAQMAGLDPTTCAPLSNYPGFFPVNNGSTVASNTNLSSINRIDSGLAKIDFHINQHHSLNGMYFISQGAGTVVDFPSADVAPEWLTVQAQRAQTGSVNWVWTPNSSWVNEVRAGYAHNFLNIDSADSAQNPADYHFRGSTYHFYTGQTIPAYFGLPQIQIAGFNLVLGNQWPKTIGPDGVFQIVDHASYLRGKHVFKFGGEVLINKSTNNATGTVKGPVNFGDLPSFFQGIPNQAQVATGNVLRHYSSQGYALFVQDDWRIKPNVTLNLGLRYELNTVLKESNNLLGNFDPNLGLVQVGKQISAPFSGDHNNFGPRLGVAWDIGGKGATVLRAGFGIIYEQLAYDVFNEIGDLGLRVLPTGANIYVNGVQQPSPGNIAVSIVSYSGDALQGTTVPGQIAYDWIHNGPNNPLYQATATCGDGNPVTGVLPTPQPCSVLSIIPNLRTPYVTNWTLDLQRVITKHMTLEVGYVGNHGSKLLSVSDINQPPVGAGWTAAAKADCLAGLGCSPDAAAEQAARPFNAKFPYLQHINRLANGDRSNYNALQAILTQRDWHGMSFVAGYTYGHALDEESDNAFAFRVPLNSSNPNWLYGNSDYDIRHRFTLAFTYQIPGRNAPAQLLKGWSINSVVTLQSGLPWGPNDFNNDFSGTGAFSSPGNPQGELWDFFGKRSDFTTVHGLTNTNGGVGGVPYFSGSNLPGACLTASNSLGPLALASLANSGCFMLGNSVLVPPAYGTYGTSGRNIFRDSGFRNWDFSVAKSWKFRELLTAQFRAEFFNILNHPLFANPYGGASGGAGSRDPSGGAGFGCGCVTPDVGAANPVLGTGGSRAIQLGLKLLF